MAGFTLCQHCRDEYEDPADRRFHAQPNACSRCGPRLELWDPGGSSPLAGAAALEQAVIALRAGLVVAVKGLGGFHLMASATNSVPLRRLREGKARREKAFALMAGDLGMARTLCRVDSVAERLLTSPAAPIVLLPRHPDAPVHDLVAPGRRCLGVMLAATPLHHLLMAAYGDPLVATSGNLKDEPICTCEHEALERLAGLAQLFLVHDRPIARHVDDSVVQVAVGRPRLIRRARGYAPRPVSLGRELPCLLAVGGHQKVTVALSAGRDVFLSQHLGDMETPEALAALERTVADFTGLYAAAPVAVVHDSHPDYATTLWAREEAARRGVPCMAVQHHHAHMAACLAEQDHQGVALGVTWDGTGHGDDGTVWGGEFLEGTTARVTRVAHLHPFRLPGSAAAIRQPRRVALAMLWAMDGPGALARTGLRPIASFRPQALEILGQMLEKGINSPVTTSAGRLFDGVASLLGLRQEVHEEGIAAVELEQLADPGHLDAYPLPLVKSKGLLILDWRVTVRALLDDQARGASPARIAARFHNALAAGIVDLAGRRGQEFVALTGGCFQNVLLLERTVAGLEKAGHRVLLNRQVPCNDGGLSLGQIAVAAARLGRVVVAGFGEKKTEKLPVNGAGAAFGERRV
jgi:hydrogenase maturation protein HypF